MTSPSSELETNDILRIKIHKEKAHGKNELNVKYFNKFRYQNDITKMMNRT